MKPDELHQIINQLIEIKNRGGHSPVYESFLDRRISMRRGQLLRGNV